MAETLLRGSVHESPVRAKARRRLAPSPQTELLDRESIRPTQMPYLMVLRRLK